MIEDIKSPLSLHGESQTTANPRPRRSPRRRREDAKENSDKCKVKRKCHASGTRITYQNSIH